MPSSLATEDSWYAVCDFSRFSKVFRLQVWFISIVMY